MRSLTRGIILLGLGWLEFILFSQVIHLQHTDGDPSRIIVLFLVIILVAIVMGIIVAVTVVPAIGEAIGNFFFSPGQEVEKSPHSAALAKIAHGDYKAAIGEYKQNVENDPNDVHAISEIVRLNCDKLEDPDAAEAYLTEALQKEWPPEQGAFLAFRLVDVYWNYKRDATSARHILTQITETMPDTRHAANAVHRLHEIDRALAGGEVEETPVVLHSEISPELSDEAEAEA